MKNNIFNLEDIRQEEGKIYMWYYDMDGIPQLGQLIPNSIKNRNIFYKKGIKLINNLTLVICCISIVTYYYLWLSRI